MSCSCIKFSSRAEMRSVIFVKEAMAELICSVFGLGLRSVSDFLECECKELRAW